MLSGAYERVLVMKQSDTTYILGAAFMALTNIFYCCTMWFGIKLPRYYPTEHVWKWFNEKGVPSQGWYGMQGFAFLAAGIVTLVIYFILKRSVGTEINLKPALTKLIGMTVTLVVVICMGYMLYHEFNKWGVFASLGWQ